MKKIIAMLLAVVLSVSALAVPAFANEAEIMTITEDMISAEGATVEYDSYLSAYRITPDAAGETVTVRLTENLYYAAMWLPATAADSSLDISAENDSYMSKKVLHAGHKFESFGIGFEGENCWMTYTPSDTYSIYLYDKMMAKKDGSIDDLANGSLAVYEEEYLDLDTYDVGRYTKYYWDGDIVFNESFMVVEEKDGTVAPNAMMYEIDRVVSVRNSYLSTEYVYGEDYLVEDGKLVIPEGSAIRRYAHSTVYKDTSASGFWQTLDGSYVYAGQHDMYFTGYLNITYTVKDAWDGPVPESKGMYLDNITKKLNTTGETVKILGIGDSIAGGANVSSDIGYTGVSPYADAWAQMTSKEIQNRYPDVTVEYDVIAQGGATATLAIEKMKDIVAYAPDLLMIEFGTNECMAGETDEYYINTLIEAIEAVNENLPECDIILVAPIISNPLIFPSDWFYSYADALYSLEREGVAVSDTVSILQYIISRKDYIDMTGDFLCHPNDFANRVFVQSILKTLETGTEDEYIAGLADRITKYRYEAEFDPADWENFVSLREAASADIAFSATADEARAKYMEHAEILDAVPTSKDNIANATLDVSKIVFETQRPMDIVGESTAVSSRYDSEKKALALSMVSTRNATINIDYTAGDNAASADDFGYAVITVMAPLTNSSRATTVKLTYTTESGAVTAKNVPLILDGGYHSYVIDLTDEAKWSGEIKSLTIQPFAAAAKGDELYVNSIVLATDSENALDLAIERERAAKADAAEAYTFLFSDDATSDALTTQQGESYLAGDVDGNGKITAVDSLLMRHYLANYVEVKNPAALDADASGSIDAADAMVVRMTLAGLLAETVVGGADAEVSYSTAEQAAEIKIKKDNATLTVDLAESGLSGDMFKYITVCAKNANGEAVDVKVTLTYADGTAEKTVAIDSNELFNAGIAKFTEASGDLVSVAFTFDAAAGETVYFDSFVLTPTLSTAQNAVAVRVGAANLF